LKFIGLLSTVEGVAVDPQVWNYLPLEVFDTLSDDFVHSTQYVPVH